jgi:hypothetical protein
MQFVGSLIAMIFVSTVAWDSFLNGKVYDCTDGGELDFWSARDWVHHPVTVEHVVSGRSMSEPDTIKKGWSMARLWQTWYLFIAISLVVSFCLALVPWIPWWLRNDEAHVASTPTVADFSPGKSA